MLQCGRYNEAVRNNNCSGDMSGREEGVMDVERYVDGKEKNNVHMPSMKSYTSL